MIGLILNLAHREGQHHRSRHLEKKRSILPEEGVHEKLMRIHEKLQKPEELLKLHLKHHHMSPSQFRKRTSALKIPESIYKEYERISKECAPCQKVKYAPSRSRISGLRAEVLENCLS